MNGKSGTDSLSHVQVVPDLNVWKRGREMALQAQGSRKTGEGLALCLDAP